MIPCELLRSAKREAKKQKLPTAPLSTCDFYALRLCRGVGRQEPGIKTAPACFKIPEAVPDIRTGSTQIVKFERRQELTARGRPLPAGT